MILFLSLVFAFSGDRVVEASAESLLTKLQDASNRVTTFACGFTQEKNMALFSKPVRFQGLLYVERPDKLRWEFVSPVPSVLVLNGEQGARCDERMVAERFSLKTDPVMRAVAQQLWLWLGGDYMSLEERYHVEEKGDDTIVVTPSDPGTAQYISMVTMVFDEVSLQPEQVVIDEPGGNRTSIVFENPEINIDLAAGLFSGCRDE